MCQRGAANEAGGRMTAQLDIIRDDPARNAQAWRTAADMALVNPWFDDKTKQARYEHYIAEAQRLEALAGVRK